MIRKIIYTKKTIISIFFIFILFFTHTITLKATDCGDVDNNSFIDIIDALLIAQYYADLDPENFDPLFANVDGNDVIDIIDALYVAQYSVDLITSFPGNCESPAPTETPDPTTPPPTPDPVNPVNIGELKKIIPLSASEESQLMSNGFLVLDSISEDTMTESYQAISSQDEVSTFLTTDVLLHVFHITYAHMLEIVEKEYFIYKFTDILTVFEADVSLEYDRIGDESFFKEPCRQLWIFAAVAKALINGDTSFTGNIDIETEIQNYLDKIYAHTDVEPFPGEDYTYYKPRSHYVNDEQLEQYFRAMTWCERHKFDINNDDDIAAAAIMASLFKNNTALKTFYEEFYNILSSLKNTTISITPLGVDMAMQNTFDTAYQSDGYSLLELNANRTKLKDNLADENYGDDPFIQFFGEHKALDIMVFKQTTHPLVEKRYTPCGIDVASTVFNSQAAYDEYWIQKEEFPSLMEQIDTLRALFDEVPDREWKESASNYWLYTLRTLSINPGGSIPPFMQTGIWEREKLNTQLASWTELHSDSVYIPSTPTPSPTPSPTPTPVAGTGDVLIVPSSMTVGITEDFSTEVHVNTGSLKIAAYGIEITYDENLIGVDTDIGEKGVEPGAQGFVSAVNISDPGKILITGFDASGTGPSTDLHLLTINWTAGLDPGTVTLGLTVDDLVDENTITIGNPNGIGSTVTITSVMAGDVNDDGSIDIVDALLTAQYFVGLSPPVFNVYWADANCDGSIDIIDALLIAQFYVGIIGGLCFPIPTPSSMPSATPSPTPGVVTASPTPQTTGVPSVPPTPTPTPPPCFVEPYPAFYEQLKEMCNHVKDTLTDAGIQVIHVSRLQKIHDWSEIFGSYAQKQLDGNPLTPEENENIHNFSIDLGIFFSESSSFVPEPYSKAQVVSAIYTYEEEVLHEGTGYINPIIVIYPLPGQADGITAVGYVLSYYEFSREDSTRLTDEEWINELPSTKRPLWTDIFIAQ